MTQTDKQSEWRRKRLWVQLQVGCSFPTSVERAGVKCWRGLAASRSRPVVDSCHRLPAALSSSTCSFIVACSVIVTLLCHQSPALSSSPSSATSPLLCHCPLAPSLITCCVIAPFLFISPLPCHRPLPQSSSTFLCRSPPSSALPLHQSPALSQSPSSVILSLPLS